MASFLGIRVKVRVIIVITNDKRLRVMVLEVLETNTLRVINLSTIECYQAFFLHCIYPS